LNFGLKPGFAPGFAPGFPSGFGPDLAAGFGLGVAVVGAEPSFVGASRVSRGRRDDRFA
jgi:hypothetical protein